MTDSAAMLGTSYSVSDLMIFQRYGGATERNETDPQRANERLEPKRVQFFPRVRHRMPFLDLARCGECGEKMLDVFAFFHCAPLPLLARCASYPRIIDSFQ